MDWFERIRGRRTIRQYWEQVGPQDLEDVRGLCARAVGVQGNPVRLELVPGNMVHPLCRGFIASYGKIIAPWYIAAVGGKDPQELLDLGFAGERLVLELQDLGLGSCWLGGMYDRAKARELVDLAPDEAVQAFIAWGIPAKETWGAVLKKMGGLHKRKELSAILLEEQELSETQQKIAEAVRWAPSAANQQPWRLSFTSEGINLFSAGKGIIGHRLLLPIDMGIALCHLQMACAELGVDVTYALRPEVEHPERDYWGTYLYK